MRSELAVVGRLGDNANNTRAAGKAGLLTPVRRKITPNQTTAVNKFWQIVKFDPKKNNKKKRKEFPIKDIKANEQKSA
jgi:hypothetical protein